MPQSFQTCQPNDPRYNLDWRWQAAQQPSPPPRRSRRKTVDTPAPATGDEWIAPARDYLNGGRTAPHSSAIEGAIAIRDAGKGSRRAEVEALLLTKVPFSDIAERCGIVERTVDAFHGLFFHVRGRLNDPEWINARVLGRDPNGHCRDYDDGAIWKRVAYDHGVLTLDLYMAASRDRKLPKEYVSCLGPNAKDKEIYERTRIRHRIEKQRVRTDELRAAYMRFEETLNETGVGLYGDESRAERAMRELNVMLMYASKVRKNAMRKADREKAKS